MTNGDSEPYAQVITQPAQSPPKEHLPHENNKAHTDVNQPQLSKHTEIPTPSTNTSNERIPELVGDTALKLTEKLQQALRHVKVLETYKTKLYEDNCQLVAAVSVLNERLTFTGASHNTQVLHLVEMQEKLRTSELSREKLGRKYQDMLASVLAGSPHHHLAVELQAIRNAYSQLDREYHMLRDKYARLKGARGTGHVTQQQVLPVPSQGPVPVAQVHWGHNPMAYTQRQPASDVQIPGPQPQGQSRSHPVSPTSSIYPGDLQGSLQQQENHTRRRSEGVSQQQLQRGSSPIATTWLPALPTPPPTAPLYRGPISPSAFPVHAPMQPVPVGGYPPHSPAHNALPIHTPMTYRSRSVSGPAMSPQARHLVGQDAIYVPSSRGTEYIQRRIGVVDLTQNRPGATHNAQAGPPTPPESSASQWMHSLKRPNSVLLASDSQQGELKKPRIEGEAQRQVSEPTTAGVDTPNQSPPRATSVTPNAPSSAKSSPTGPTDAQSNSESVVSDSVKDIRSFEECVNLIFEKDADVEHGVFCGLCFDRYKAKMIPEPPDVLIQPDFDLLVKHCTTMHPTAWEDLRCRKDAEKT